MMWLSDMFSARKQRLFLDLHRQQSAVLLQAARSLQRFVEGGAPAAIDDIAKMAERSDDLLKRTIAALTDTFVTPFDRQDIYNLALSIDDMMHYLESAAREIVLFKIASTPPMVEMVKILASAAEEINICVVSIESDSAAAVEHATKASEAEDRVEDLYRRTVAELFETTDVQRIFKLREIYRHLSNGADRADAIGKLVGKIVVKVA